MISFTAAAASERRQQPQQHFLLVFDFYIHSTSSTNNKQPNKPTQHRHSHSNSHCFLQIQHTARRVAFLTYQQADIQSVIQSFSLRETVKENAFFVLNAFRGSFYVNLFWNTVFDSIRIDLILFYSSVSLCLISAVAVCILCCECVLRI